MRDAGGCSGRWLTNAKTTSTVEARASSAVEPRSRPVHSSGLNTSERTNERTTVDVTTARTAVAQSDETYIPTAVATTARITGTSKSGCSPGHRAGTRRTGTPIGSSSAMLNTVATFTAH